MLENVNICDGYDFLDYVLSSDIFVGDCSSTLVEFFSTGRQVILTGNIHEFSTLGLIISKFILHTNDIDEIKKEISTYISDFDPLKNQRKKIFDALFLVKEKYNSANYLKDFILDDFIKNK